LEIRSGGKDATCTGNMLCGKQGCLPHQLNFSNLQKLRPLMPLRSLRFFYRHRGRKGHGEMTEEFFGKSQKFRDRGEFFFSAIIIINSLTDNPE